MRQHERVLVSAVPRGKRTVLEVEIDPRRPRLVWQGMEQHDVVRSVPTQVVEIVDLAGSREPDAQPHNRLIWTRDNLIALQTLLDERDPETGAFRYRGRVDLVYIDPPFMVNSDFRTDPRVEIGDGKASPAALRLAYKDTWRTGLDGFLSMLRARLVLLHALLAPTGSIYVHLDWHAVHYVKVLMDEIFGHENFVNEITWQRQTSHSDLAQGAKHLGRVHDTLLVYRISPSVHAAPLHTPYDASYVRSHYRHTDDAGRRFQDGDLTGPGGAAKGNPSYALFGHVKHWRYTEARMRELVAEGKVVQPPGGGVPRMRRFLDDMPGVPLQDVWTDLHAVNSQAREALGYPTQKPVALLDRILRLSCPPGGLVLDCFGGSGTTAEAAERCDRRWIVIDHGKHAIDLARKRLLRLHGTMRAPDDARYDYVECERCHALERKARPQGSRGRYDVRPFTLEHLGVHLDAETRASLTWGGRERDALIRIHGGEPTPGHGVLHGKVGDGWVHVAPPGTPFGEAELSTVAREAREADARMVTVLAAEVGVLAARAEIEAGTGVTVRIRRISASAFDEVRRRLADLPSADAEPVFQAVLAISLRAQVSGLRARIELAACEIDDASLAAHLRSGPLADGTPALGHAPTAWQPFVDAWSIDWDHGSLFRARWQSVRLRRARSEAKPPVFHAEHTYERPGSYRVAARVTDVFGNDGLAILTLDVH